MKYDYLIVGAGLFGAVCANLLKDAGKKCIVIDKRPHIAGNVYSEQIEGIEFHKYGAHIFHTSDEDVWNYVNKFTKFNNFINAPIANYKGKLYNLPFNMNTFYQLWGVTTPDEARKKIKSQRIPCDNPRNLEQQALSLAGHDIYETLIKGYTEKQWGMPCTDLPAFIIKRLPFRFQFDNNYFNDCYQGIPINGYTAMIAKMLEDVEVKTSTAYKNGEIPARHIIYTGAIDEYFEYSLGALEYRSLKFETEILDTESYQGNVAVNYTSNDIPYTRIIEHKHFSLNAMQPKTIITREYPDKWKKGDEPYYPVNNEKNNSLYKKYEIMAKNEKNVTFGGRLGMYKYFDMDKVISAAFNAAKSLSGGVA